MNTGRWRVGVDLSDCVPIFQEEVLKCDVVIMVVFRVVKAIVAKNHELCRHQHHLGNKRVT